VQHKGITVGLIAALLWVAPALAGNLIEPQLRIARGGSGAPQVALTLDACSGGVDERILGTLLDRGIPATIFVTARWLERNPEALKVLLSRPDLFEIEDHGRSHIPAVIGAEKPYGLDPAGTPEAVIDEVAGGAEAVRAATGARPVWYRGATALYSADALDLIARLGFRVAGFSLNADFGATASEQVAAERVTGAKDGDVIIAHINQPARAAGAGIARGIIALQDKGFRFVRLADVTAE